MHVLFDQRSTRAKRITDIPNGSAVIARNATRSALGIILGYEDPQVAGRYLLTSDEVGPHVPEQQYQFAAVFADAESLRVSASDPWEGRAPGKPEEALGVLGVDLQGAFVTIDARQQARERTLSTVNLHSWTLSYATHERVYRAEIFFRRWKIVIVDAFGNQSPILSGGTNSDM